MAALTIDAKSPEGDVEKAEHIHSLAEPIATRAEAYEERGYREEGFDLAPIDAVAERRLVRKLDLCLLPILTLVYLSNFIDRSSVGNARSAGLLVSLNNMSPYAYNAALTTYYVTYMLINPFSNLAVKRVGPRFLAFVTLAFGITSLGTAFIHTPAQLIVMRGLLGIFEGCTVPGITYIFARWYTRKELVMRVSVFLAGSAALAGGFGSLLASGFLASTDFGEVRSWRKIFFFEGIITIGIGLIAIFAIPGAVETTRMFNETERTLAIARMRRQAIGTNVVSDPITVKMIFRAFTPLTILCGCGYAFTNISVQGLSLFMPIIIQTLGQYSTIQVQLRSAPPFIVGGVWTLAIAYASLRLRKRGALIAFSSLFCIVGYALFIGTNNSKARYAACFLAFMGAVPNGPLFLSWATDNASPDTLRSVAIGLVLAIGNIGSIIATWSYLPSDAPQYHDGNSLNVGVESGVFCLALIGIFYVRRENRLRSSGRRDHRLEQISEKEAGELGWLHPRFEMQE